MAFIDEFADVMPASLTYNVASSSIDEYGRPTYGAAQTVACRIQGRNRQIRTLTDEQKISRVQIYTGAVTGITTRDRITLPSPWTPTTPVILDVRPLVDEAGVIGETIYT